MSTRGWGGTDLSTALLQPLPDAVPGPQGLAMGTHDFWLATQLAKDGVLSTRDATAGGLSSHGLSRLCRAGLITPLTRGFYAVAEVPDAVARHRLTTLALLRRFGPATVASHHSALLLEGLPVCKKALHTVHLTRRAGRSTRVLEGARIHASLDIDCGPRTVPLAVACAQAGLVAPPVWSAVAADAALHAGRVELAELEDAVSLLRAHTNISAVRAVMADLDGRHESAGETLSAHIMRRLEYRFTPQVSIGPWTCDFALDDEPVMIEFDGLLKYRGLAGAALAAEKSREDDIRARGRVVVRLIWDDLTLRTVDRKIQAGIHTARRGGLRL
ncbi:type IV toxin-antitoxin system AbiEi family antitoxin domain-containing protein [Actinomycetota bacterium]